MDFDTVPDILAAFYRLVGTSSDDPALVANGEAVDDVAYLCLTEGSRAGQRWLLSVLILRT